MAELAHNTTHVQDGLARLLTRWKDKPRMVAFVRIILERVQHLEDVLWDLYTNSWLDTAVGAQLDNLGGIVGEPRKGRADEQYRHWVKARIAINRANGQVTDTFRVLRLVLESTASIAYKEEHPAAYHVEVHDTALSANEVSSVLKEVKPAGVQLTTVVATDSVTAFILNTSTPLANGFNHGLMADGI